MYPLLVCGGSLAVNGALVALSTLAAVRGSTDRAAAYELVLSLFYALQLTLTWRAAANVMIVLSSGFKEWMESGVLPRLVLALVLLLLLMQARNPSSSSLVGPSFRSYWRMQPSSLACTLQPVFRSGVARAALLSPRDGIRTRRANWSVASAALAVVGPHDAPHCAPQPRARCAVSHRPLQHFKARLAVCPLASAARNDATRCDRRCGTRRLNREDGSVASSSAKSLDRATFACAPSAVVATLAADPSASSAASAPAAPAAVAACATIATARTALSPATTTPTVAL